DLAEISHRENIGLLSYSALAFGMLTGKYINGTANPNSRLNLFPHMKRYSSKQCHEATKRYMKIAKNNGLSLAQMALAFVNQQPFLTSTIVAATSLEQLKENIGSIHITLSDTVLKEINEVHAEIPNPAT